MTIKFDVLNRFSGRVQFVAEIECSENELPSVKLGLAVKWAVTSGAYLGGANLSGAYLSYAYLSGANLSDAYLRDANLGGANLSGAYLSGANLSGANLRGANLDGANLRGANLDGANLSDAYLRYAYLSDAKGAELAIAKTRILPDGDLIGWKKCISNVIVKLRIPAEARRSHAFGRKCRTEYADVLEVIGSDVGISQHDDSTEYRVGARVAAHKWDEDWQDECAGGIHFYITRLEAEAH